MATTPSRQALVRVAALLLAAACALLAPAPAAAAPGDKRAALPDGASYTMFLMLSQSASVDPGGPDGSFTLTMRGTTPMVFMFKDRPDRQTAVFRLEEFLPTFSFSPRNPPNAALTAVVAGGNM